MSDDPLKRIRAKHPNLLERIKAHMGWDNNSLLIWFCTDNPLFGGVTPAVFYLLRPEKTVKVIETLLEENKTK